MWSTKSLGKKDTEDATISNIGKVTNLALAGIETTGKPGNIYTDQTGRLPVTSRKGTQCVLYYTVTTQIQPA